MEAKLQMSVVVELTVHEAEQVATALSDYESRAERAGSGWPVYPAARRLTRVLYEKLRVAK